MAQLKCWGFSVSSFDQHAVLLAFVGSLVLTKHKCLGDFRHWNSHIIHDYCPFRPIASWENMLIPWQGAFEGYRAPICCRVQKTMDCPEPGKKKKSLWWVFKSSRFKKCFEKRISLSYSFGFKPWLKLKKSWAGTKLYWVLKTSMRYLLRKTQNLLACEEFGDPYRQIYSD